MIRTPLFAFPAVAVLAVALLGGTAMAAPTGAPAPSASDNAPSSRSYQNDDDDAPAPPPPGNAGTKASAEQARAERDMFCRRDAAAHTGYTTPGEAARDEQARGSIGGALGGAALGAIIGGAGHGNAGSGAAIGAGAGLLAGTAVGAANANRAAADVERAYSDAYYACMGEADADGPPPPRYARGSYAYDPAYGPPPPYYAYGPYPYPYYYYPPYYGPAYGPSIYFGFGGGRGWGYHGWHR